MSIQGQIDELGGGKSIRDWEARFELAYKVCKDKKVTLVGGVAPTATRFARYLRKKHGIYPKDLWGTQVMTLGSVPGINTRLRPALRALYGPVAIRGSMGPPSVCLASSGTQSGPGSLTTTCSSLRSRPDPGSSCCTS